MRVLTIGFARHSAEEFFTALDDAGVGRLLDVRLSNRSQLAGFSKRDDLAFFLRGLCGVAYEHRLDLAPTAPLLAAYRKGEVPWTEYAEAFTALLIERQPHLTLDRATFEECPTVLLCSEPTAEHCHRRLVAEFLAEHWEGVAIRHL